MLKHSGPTQTKRRSSMPTAADWEPPYPAFSAAFKPDVQQVVMAYYGCVTAPGEEAGAAPFLDWIRDAAAAPQGPAVANRARHMDAQGRTNEVFILYWTDPARFAAWEASPPVKDWWLSPQRLEEPTGYWREVWQPPLSHLETLISSQSPIGLAEARQSITGPVRAHAYWGSARDRIPQSTTDDFEPVHDVPPRPAEPPSSGGQRLRVTPPQHLCLIRSGQNWTNCGPDELELYRRDVLPALVAGMNFLRDNPDETGCLSCRFMDQVSLDGTSEQKTFATACFLSLGHLEAWAKSHPTHLSIFGAFHRLVKQRNFEIDLKLWHEVSVMPAGAGTCEYINCPPDLGLLPYFQATAF